MSSPPPSLGELVVGLSDALTMRGLGARIVRLVCDQVDRGDQVVTVGMARGTRDVDHLLRLLAIRIKTIDPGFGINATRLIAVRTKPLGAIDVDYDLGMEDCPRAAGDLVDQIATPLGDRRRSGRPRPRATCPSDRWP